MGLTANNDLRVAYRLRPFNSKRVMVREIVIRVGVTTEQFTEAWEQSLGDNYLPEELRLAEFVFESCLNLNQQVKGTAAWLDLLTEDDEAQDETHELILELLEFNGAIL